MANIITDEHGSSFFIGDYIEKGSFSKVYTLQCCQSQRLLAGKFISKEKLKKFGTFDKVWDEIKIHQILRHPNIVQFHTYIERPSHIIMVLEYCSRYSLVHILHSLKTLTICEAKYFMLQIVSAVEYLHLHNIVHRDLKLGNLFVNKRMEIKLGDFGLAVKIDYNGQKRFSRCGTPNYIAPEVINGVGHSYEVDIWALGCILHTMLEGTPPFQGANTTSTYNNILRCEYHFSPNMNNSARVFIMSCLQGDPRYRPNIFELKHFEFLITSEIFVSPPEFSFGEGEILNLTKKRKLTSETRVSNVLIVKQPASDKELPNIFFQKLLKCLLNINNWNESSFSEFLAESSSILPLVWVNSWMDYSNCYGFVYQLSNKNFGIVFNDGTRMLFKNEQETIHYVQSNGSVVICQKDSIPNKLRKKLKILLSCQKYMNESLLKAHESNIPEDQKREGNHMVEVFKWTSRENEMVMFLTNGSIQMNFATDHTKLIVCGVTKTVTIIERADYMKTLKLDILQKCGCSKELKNKLYRIFKHVQRFLAEA